MNTKNIDFIKRTEKDYSLPYKLKVIDEVEKGYLTYKQAQTKYGIQGRSTVLVWLRKHGNLDWSNPTIYSMPQPKRKLTPAEQIKKLEKQLKDEKLKNLILNTMIDVSDTQYGTAIRKKYASQQSESSSKKNN